MVSRFDLSSQPNVNAYDRKFTEAMKNGFSSCAKHVS